MTDIDGHPLLKIEATSTTDGAHADILGTVTIG